MNTPEINLTWLESATLADLKVILKLSSSNPDILGQVNALLATPEGKKISYEMLNNSEYVPVSKRVPDPAEAAAIAADTARADEQAAADAAAIAAAANEGLPPAPTVEEKKKIVIEYQATAEDGTPIGRPTHIEGWTEEEVREKLKNAHINAVRYAERLKKGKVQNIESQTEQRKTQQAAQQSKTEADAAMTEAAKDTTKIPDAIRKQTKADREAEIAKQSAQQHEAIVAQTWLKDHEQDFLICDANSNIVGEWLKANNLVFSYENLELAFAANETRLAKPEPPAPVVAASAPPAANPPAAAPAVAPTATPSIPAPVPAAVVPASTVEAPVSQPASTTTAPTSVAATNTPATRRPGVNGGLQPGSLTAVRPTGQQITVASTLTELKREIAKMSPVEYRKALQSDKFVARCRAAGLTVVGHSA